MQTADSYNGVLAYHEFIKLFGLYWLSQFSTTLHNTKPFRVLLTDLKMGGNKYWLLKDNQPKNVTMKANCQKSAG
jgi:hypothetical protein